MLTLLGWTGHGSYYYAASNPNGYTNDQTAAEIKTLLVNGLTATHLAAGSVGASELNVSGNGSTSQFLRSDADGTFTWATPTDTNTTYSVGDGGLSQINFTSADILS